MKSNENVTRPSPTSAVALSDEEAVERVRAGDTTAFEALMRRHNQRVYRVVRAVLNREDDVEDVMQQAYVNAFRSLRKFEGRSAFSTWLTRIAVNEAIRKRQTDATNAAAAGRSERMIDAMPSPDPDPERAAYGRELRVLLERAIDALPEAYRLVFVLRDVEGLSTSDTAATLDVGEEAVKTRLHRARAMMRRGLMQRVGETTAQAFQFHLSRCDRLVAAVLAEISRESAA